MNQNFDHDFLKLSMPVKQPVTSFLVAKNGSNRSYSSHGLNSSYGMNASFFRKKPLKLALAAIFSFAFFPLATHQGFAADKSSELPVESTSAAKTQEMAQKAEANKSDVDEATNKTPVEVIPEPKINLYAKKPAGEFPNPLTLEYLLNELPVQSPAVFLQNAKLARKQAKGLGIESVNAWKLDLEGRLTRREFTEEPQNHHRAALHIGKQLYDFGVTDGLTLAQQQEIESEAGFQNFVLQSHKLKVMQSFFDVILADFQYRIDNEQMAIEYIAYDKSKDRHEVGQVSDVAMIEAESNYQQALLKRSQAEQRQLSSRVSLANTMGYAKVRPDEMKMPSLKGFSKRDAKALNLDELYQKLEENNPQLQRLKGLWQAQLQRVEALRNLNSPTIRADAWAGKLSSHPELREGSWRADLSIHVPLYDGQANKSELMSAQAKAIKLSAEYEQQAQMLRQEIADIYFQLKLLKAEQEANFVFGDYADLYLDFSRALYENERATDLGSSMVRLSEANYRMVEWQFKQALLWSQLDLLLGKMVGKSVE